MSDSTDDFDYLCDRHWSVVTEMLWLGRKDTFKPMLKNALTIATLSSFHFKPYMTAQRKKSESSAAAQAILDSVGFDGSQALTNILSEDQRNEWSRLQNEYMKYEKEAEEHFHAFEQEMISKFKDGAE